MHRSSRRLLALAVAIVVFLLSSALLYQEAMLDIEGKPRTFWQSLSWAAGTLSTTGYGGDVRWDEPMMIVFVAVVQLIGLFLIFMIVPVVMIPFLERRFEERLPREAGEIAHHIVIFRFGPAVETLLQRLKRENVPSLLVETDEAAARTAMEAGHRVVFSRSEEDALDSCRLRDARAFVANGRDEENAAIILRARQLGFRGEIFAFVEEPAHRRPIELAGATSAYTPRHIIAAALALHASDAISPRLPGSEAISGIERREVRVPASSPLAGKTLAEAEIGARTGAVVVGQWSRRQLNAACDRNLRIEPGAILELAGDGPSLDRASALVGARFMRNSGPFLIAGFGEVGRKVHQLLTDAGEEVKVIERFGASGVDFAGNVLDPSVLERAGISNSRGVVLALNSDDATLFATVICRDAAPDVPVIARVNHERNIDNIYRAGADYALSISDISGEMLTSRLLGRSRTREQHRKIAPIRVGGSAAGRALSDLPIRKNSSSVIAIGRKGTFVTRVDAGTRVESGDVLYVCGNAEALKLLEELTT